MTDGDLGRRQLWLGFVAVILLFAASAIFFARAQNIWVDESTQLSGMTLSPAALLAWLSGSYSPPFGVPPDRMPPVSYLIDHVGWLLWGSNVMALRLLHATIAAAGIIILMAALARRYGGRAAIIAGLVLALSPRVIDVAVEIRAYPIFLALSCVQAAMILRGDVTGSPRRLLVFLLLCLLSGYTHFFGVIGSSAFFLAALIDTRSWRAAVFAALGYGVILLLWLGLAPLVLGAASISSAEVAGTGGADKIVTFGFQLLGHSAMMVNPMVALVYFLGVALLAVPSLAGLVVLARARHLELRHEPALGLLVALVAGLLVCVLAGMLARGFNTIAPRYNIWTVPALAALLGIAGDGLLSAPGRIARATRLAGLALLAVGAVWAQIAFMSRAAWYIHGPSRALEAMIADAGPDVAVVYAGTSWGWGYFPLYWRHRDALPQWLISPDGTQVVRIGRGGDPNGTPEPLTALARYPVLVLAAIQPQTYLDLRRLSGNEPESVKGGPELFPAIQAAGWRLRETVSRPGIYALTGQVYQKGGTP